MKHLLLLLLAVFMAAGAAYFAGRVYDAPDAEIRDAVRLKQAEIALKAAEAQLIQTKVQAEARLIETKVQAKARLLTLQNESNIVNAPEVIRARVQAKVLFALWPFAVMAAAGAGGVLFVLYAAIRRVEFQAAGVQTFVTRRQAAVLAERALYLQGVTEQAKIAALTEQIGQARFTQGVSLFAALGRAWRSGANALQAALPEAAESAPSQPVVSFAEMLRQDKFTTGKPLLFGFDRETNAPRQGTWQDCYSLGIAGQSGFGKSASIRLIMAESLLTGAVGRFYVVDPHWPHEKSLLASLGALRDAPQVDYAHDAHDVTRILAAVNREIDERLGGKRASTPVHVLIIDEVLTAVKIDGVADIMERIGCESRKAGVYGMFAAQGWVGAKTGGTTARDALTALLCHNLKRKQAQTLLQDADLAKQATKLKVGEALFLPAAGDPEILTIPFASKDDMREVVLRLTPQVDFRQANAAGVTQDTGASVTRPEQATGASNIETPVERAETARNVIDFEQKRAAKRAETLDERPDAAETPAMSDSDLREQTNALLDAKRETLSGLATKTGVNKGGLYRFLRQNDNPSDTLRAALAAFLRQETGGNEVNA